MAQTPQQIKDSFPLPAYNYRVRLGSDYYAFSQVSGLNLRYDTVTYRHGLSWLEGATHMPGIQQPVNVTLERGVVRQGSVLLDWINSVNLGSVDREDVIVDLCDEEGVPTVSWTIFNAFPTQLDAPEFNANSNEVAIERLQLTGNDLSIEFHS